MNTEQLREQIHAGIDRLCAPLTSDPYLVQRVLKAARKEGVYSLRMKHRLSLGMILIIVLLSISLTAGAVTAISYFIDRAATLQEEKGNMSRWTLDEKIELIVSMKESGVDVPQEQIDKLLSGELSAEEANHIADRLIVEKKHAREALEDRYGFTRTTFAFLSTQVDFVENAEVPENSYWLVSYVPTICAEKIGCYYVRVNALTRAIIAVEWEYDAVFRPESNGEDWHADIWDVPLVDRLVSFEQEIQEKKAEQESILGAFETWTLQDKAAFDQVYLDYGYPYGDMPLNVLPEENDISPEDAVSFARVCIEDTYGIDQDILSDFRIEQTLFNIEGANEKLYIIEFHHQKSSEYYAVEFSSETKTIDLCAHYVNQVYIAPQPVNDTEPCMIDKPLIPENMIEAAKMALKEEYGLTDDALRFFDTTTNMGADGWVIVFKSNTINPKTVGTYAVAYSQEGQCVDKLEWEYDSIYPTQEKQTYWKDNKIWGPYEMNCFAQLRIDTRRIVKEAGGENQMSFEQQAEYDRLYREAGYDRSEYYHGVPGICDIEQDEALRIAKEAVASKWHVSSDKLDGCDVLYEFDVSDPDQYVWRIRLLLDDGEKMYTIELDSETGDVLSQHAGSGTNG